MHPEIFSIGPFVLRSYGFMLMLGFFFGIMFAAYRAKKFGENPDHVYNLSIWIVVSSIVGARLYYVMTHFNEFSPPADAPLFTRMFLLLKNIFWPVTGDGKIGISGLILYGGIILATVATIVYLRRHRLNVPRFLDILGPSLGLGEFFTRIGCFLNGCCYGTPTDSACGIVFPQSSAAGFHYPNQPIHPTQLYMALGGLVIFLALLFLERYKRFDGHTALLYFILYATSRFIVDFFRYYESEMVFMGLSQNQILSLLIYVVAIPLFVYKFRTARSVDS